MKILVTGGAGFIGSNFIYDQLARYPEDHILCLDALSYAGNLQTLIDAKKHPHFRFIKGDIADRTCVNRLFEEEKPDIVANFAAVSHVDRSIENPEVFWGPWCESIISGEYQTYDDRLFGQRGQA